MFLDGHNFPSDILCCYHRTSSEELSKRVTPRMFDQTPSSYPDPVKKFRTLISLFCTLKPTLFVKMGTFFLGVFFRFYYNDFIFLVLILAGALTLHSPEWRFPIVCCKTHINPCICFLFNEWSLDWRDFMGSFFGGKLQIFYLSLQIWAIFPLISIYIWTEDTKTSYEKFCKWNHKCMYLFCESSL